MIRYTQRGIKELVRSGAAENITEYGFVAMRDFLHTHTLDKFGYSSGVYGINSGVLIDRASGKLYAITARNTALAMAF